MKLRQMCKHVKGQKIYILYSSMYVNCKILEC
jgi:hypothetical protein